MMAERRTTKDTSDAQDAVQSREPRWHLVDARDLILGRVATRIALLLRGKYDPAFSPHVSPREKVVVINAAHVRVTGKKREQKMYYRHSGYPGGIHSESYGELFDRDPREPLRRAVKGMLPKNKLQKVMLGNLTVYPEETHPHMRNLSKKES